MSQMSQKTLVAGFNSDDYSVAEAVEKELGGKVIEKAKFVTKYRDNKYTFCLLEVGEQS